MNDAPKPKPTIDRSRVEALVREALAREVGPERAGAREASSNIPSPVISAGSTSETTASLAAA